MKFVGIIPARYASTRFPAKVLADLNGKTVIQRVYEQVKDCFDDIYIALYVGFRASVEASFCAVLALFGGHYGFGSE